MGKLVLKSKHRVLCGDSTNPEHVQRLVDGRKIDLVFTSPPYAQQRDYGTAKAHVQDWDALMNGVFDAVGLVAAPACQVLVNLGLVHRDGEWMPYWEGWIAWMREQGWRRFGWYVWDQGPGLPGDWNGRFAPSHEFVFHFNKQSVKPEKTIDCKHAGKTLGGKGLRAQDGTLQKKTGDGNAIQDKRIPDSICRVSRERGSGLHPAMFSVGFAEYFVTAWWGAVYDPFGGSGTVLSVCQQLGRESFTMEIDPAYCDVIITRWENLTGQKAIRWES